MSTVQEGAYSEGRAQGIAEERKRCAEIAENWLATFGKYKPEYICGQTWANDAIRDVLDAINNPTS